VRTAGGEPTSPAEIATWIQAATVSHDRFRDVYDASHAHRERHGAACSVYPTDSGPLLGVLAAATRAQRLLEVGCGLGYSALWLAHGSAPDGRVVTIEQEPEHVRLARDVIDEKGFERQVTVHEGRGAEVLPRLEGGFDFVFCDSDPGEYPEDLDHFMRLLAPRGLLVTSNLFLGQYVPDHPSLERAAEYRRRILEDARFQTAFVPGGVALSVFRGLNRRVERAIPI
jgi:predicted O-methyltransferase YrrM